MYNEEIYFHISKVKFIILLIPMILFMILGVSVSIVAFKQADYIFGSMGILFAGFFGLMFYRVMKRLILNEYSLLLTKEQLIINNLHILNNKLIIIDWDDIKSFELKEYNYSTFLEIVLHNEEKYHRFMSNKVLSKKKAPIFINCHHIKKKERVKLFNELERRIFNLDLNNTLHEQIDKDHIAEEDNKEINGKYMLKAYIISLIISIFAYIFFSAEIDFLILSFLFYPFAKIFYDNILGFKLSYKWKKQEMNFLYGIHVFHYLLNILVYYLSVLIAPLGILCLIIKVFYKKRGI